MSEINREQWLMRAVDHLAPIFERSGYAIPIVKVSVGFPSTGAKRHHLVLKQYLELGPTICPEGTEGMQPRGEWE